MTHQDSVASSSSSPLYTVPPGHLLLHLSSGETAAFQLPSYPAASFYLYIPSSHPVSRRKRGEEIDDIVHSQNGRGNGNANGNGDGHGESDGQGSKSFPLVVCVHGSSRDAQGVRDRWADMAEREGLVVLCPLFPVDMETIDGMHNYKLIGYPLASAPGGSQVNGHKSKSDYTRFDLLLLEMVDLVRDRWGYTNTETFALTGYSGGAQFAHRFFYLHPNRVHTLSIGAPGTATPLSPTLPWPSGISNIQRYFDQDIDVKALRTNPTHMVVGLEDKWRPVSNDGSTPKMNRIDTMRMLRDDWRSNGLKVEYEEVDGVSHEETGVINLVQSFILEGVRARQRSA